MSINSALLAGVTGLVSNSSSLAAISDNIANANTIGYKKVGVDFSSLVNTGSASAYAAGGVSTSTHSFVTQQGTLQASSNPTDLGISGEGFFVTTPKAAGLTSQDPRFFTRAGSFTIDQNGYLKNSAGLFLQGWAADQQGNVTTDSANLTSLVPINILTVASTAKPTTEAKIQGNLDADQTPNANILTYAAGDMAVYAATNGTSGTKPDFSITVPVSDSKGGLRNIVIDFLRQDPTLQAPNTWNAEIRSDPAADITGGAQAGLISTGTVTFNPDGSINPAATNLAGISASGNVPPVGTINIGPSNGGNASPQWAAGLGVNAQPISLDLNGVNQFSAVSSVTSEQTDGTAFGGLSGVTIDNKGFVTAVYDNGTTRTIAQVAVATFPNADGLKSANGNAYQASLASGSFTLKTSGQAGAGTISPSSLEASTVDLSAEFTGLIVTQRAYSASSKIITTADQMLQELLSIKQ